MTSPNKPLPPTVRLVGQFSHFDFRDAAALLRADAQLDVAADVAPNLIVVAQSRPDEFPHREVESLQRRWPLAGIVALLSSWCEGETRTGRPRPGVKRLYWYDFPTWWRRQLALRAAGRCPDWGRRDDCGLRIADCGLKSSSIRNPKSEIRNSPQGLIVIRTATRATASALTDVLSYVGYSTVWQPRHRPALVLSGVVAGIWDGGQLNEAEADDLAAFCRQMARNAAPVVALLDFPRRDRVDHATTVGAAAVLGKPWLNTDLVGMVEQWGSHKSPPHKSTVTRAA
jgi:hypothetical protein